MSDDFTPLPSLPEKTNADFAPLDASALPESSSSTTGGGGGGAISSPANFHRKNSSSLSDLSLLEIDRKGDDGVMEVHIVHPQVSEHNGDAPTTTTIPVSTLIVVTESAQLNDENYAGGEKGCSHTILQDMLHDISDFDFTLEEGKFHIKNWDGKKGYSEYIQQGLRYKIRQAEKKAAAEAEAAKEAEAINGETTANGQVVMNGDSAAACEKKPAAPVVSAEHVVMLFESPGSCTADFTFHNSTKFRFHDWPPPAKTGGKSVLGPCRYALMNGTAYPVFLKDGKPPEGLEEHWKSAVPGFETPPTYVDKITDGETVYAYLPVEKIRHHVNDPDIHYHLAGKDAIHLMTQKTTALLSDTKSVRPCVVKTTHSMGSKGIFIIQNDDDEKEFETFLEESGHPTYVVTNFVDIARNVACHFFMHPSGSVVWFGSNENHREADGSFSSDSYLIMDHQERLKELQLPFVEEVVQYCHGLGFFGFCGVDVLFDSKDRGYLVDINPRVTGSCPALMTLKRLADRYGFTVGLFRRSGKTCYHGSPAELLSQVASYNAEHEGKSRVVIHSLFQTPGASHTRINIGVYGTNLNDCKTVLNSFAKDMPGK